MLPNPIAQALFDIRYKVQDMVLEYLCGTIEQLSYIISSIDDYDTSVVIKFKDDVSNGELRVDRLTREFELTIQRDGYTYLPLRSDWDLTVSNLRKVKRMASYPKIDDGIVAPVYQLVVLDHVDFVDPLEYDVKAESIDPCSYFVTSGDAVEKAKILERDAWRVAGNVRKELIVAIQACRKCSPAKAQQLYRDGVRPKKLKRFSEYEKAIWKVAGQSRKFVNTLRSIKAEDCFLETEWESHKLLVIPKNPRK